MNRSAPNPDKSLNCGTKNKVYQRGTAGGRGGDPPKHDTIGKLTENLWSEAAAVKPPTIFKAAPYGPFPDVMLFSRGNQSLNPCLTYGAKKPTIGFAEVATVAISTFRDFYR
jgi:hypothetical protein